MKNFEDNFLYKDLSYEVLGCAYEAFKEVGVGFDEVRYHKVFHYYLLQKGLNANYKVPVYLDYKSEIITEFEIDEIVEDKIIIELKCIQTDFLAENFAQILTYLKIKKLSIGLLINFGLHKAYPKRIIFNEHREKNVDKWDEGYFQHFNNRELIDSIIAAVRHVDDSLGTAYERKIYQSALAIELRQANINVSEKVFIKDLHKKILFSPYEIDYFLVESSLLFGILAGKDKPRLYDLLRMRSYLKKLSLHHGLIAYWSTKNLQIYGIYEP